MSKINKINFNGTLYDIGGSGGTNPVIIRDGVTYTIVVDPNTGDITAVPEEEEHHIVEDGLVAWYRVVGGVVTDVISGTTYPEVTVYTSDNAMDGCFWQKDFPLITDATKATIDYVAPRLYTGEDSGLGGRNVNLVLSGAKVRIGVSCNSSDNNASAALNGNTIYSIVGIGATQIVGPDGDYVFNFCDSHKVPKLCYFNSRGATYGADGEKCTCTILIDTTEQEDPKKNKAIAINGILFPNYSMAKIISDQSFSATMYSDSVSRLKEIRVYNRILSEEEVIENSMADKTYYKSIESFTIGNVLDGYSGFGGCYKIGATDSIIPNLAVSSAVDEGTYTDDWEHEYTISNFTAYTEPSRTESVFEGIQFISKPTTLYTFRKYSVVAYPYPFTGSFIGNGAEGSFHIMYTSSDETICACIDGILIPKSPGSVTITARLAGSNLTDSFTATVEEYDNSVSDADTKYISKRYVYDTHSLVGGSSSDTAIAMFHAIKEAAEDGYKKVIFPKRTYYIYPEFSEGSGASCCLVPSDLIVDFNGSSIYIVENPYCFTSASTNYTIFDFSSRCENSSIINATFIGERYFNTDGHSESEYSPHCHIIDYNDCYMCGTANVNFKDTVGFYYCFSNAGQYDYWGGIRDANYTIGSGLANRGRISYQEFEDGDYDSNGEPITVTGYYRTVTKMDIGYLPSDLSYFNIGTMGIRYYIVSSRWVTVWWYDAEGILLNPGGTRYFQFSKYKLPQGAVAFKLSAYGSKPTQNVGEDNCCLRIYPFRQADHCYALNMRSQNPHGWAITSVGGQHTYVGNAVLDGTRRWNYYSIDHEDNFPTTQSCVYDNIIGLGINLFGGIGHAVLSNSMSGSYRSIHVQGENESCRVMNCVCRTLYKTSKTDCVYRGIKYASSNSDAPQGSLIETDTEVISNFNTM